MKRPKGKKMLGPLKVVPQLAGAYVHGTAQRVKYRAKYARHWERAFDGKNILVVGAGAGLGAAVVRKINSVAPKSTVIVAGLPEDNDPNEPGLERIAYECGTPSIPCNVTDDDDVKLMAWLAARHFEKFTGRSEIDFAIYVPGIAAPNSALEDDTALSEVVIDVNLRGYFRFLQAVGPAVVRARGHITIFASLAAVVKLPSLGVYSATKAGVLALTESLEQEWWAAGVDFTTLIMSFIQSGMTDDARNTGAGAASAGMLDRIMIAQDAAIDIIVPGIARRQRYVFVPKYMRLTDWLPPVVLRLYKQGGRLFAVPVMAAHRYGAKG